MRLFALAVCLLGLGCDGDSFENPPDGTLFKAHDLAMTEPDGAALDAGVFVDMALPPDLLVREMHD